MKLREAAPALGVFVFALAWLLVLRTYGFQLEDEGTLLSWFDRVALGQHSYTDFHTGYTPGLFAFGSAVFQAFGPSATALRGVLAIMNAVSAAALTEVTRRVAGPWLASLPALVWLAFMPLYVGEFAAFNIPYPTWPATLAWMVLTLAMLAWARAPRMVPLVVAGVAAAAAMWVRPNSGAFALAAATWIVCAFSSRPTALDRVAVSAATATMVLGVWFTFEFRVLGMDAFVHLVPTIAIAAICTIRGKLEIAGAPPASSSLAVLAAAFLVPTLTWTVPLAARLGGADRFFYEVFLVGAGYQTLYYVPHPAPEPFAILVVLAIAAFAVTGRLVASCWLRPMPALLLAAVAAAATILVISREMVAPEGVLPSVVLQLENASYWLAAAASFGGVAWIVLAPAAVFERWPAARAMTVVTPLAIMMYAQMFPRSDFMHQVSAVPLSAVVACGLLSRIVVWWTRGGWPAGWNGTKVVRGVVLATCASVLLLVFASKAGGPLEALVGGSPVGGVSKRLDVRVEPSAAGELEAIARTVAFIREHTTQGEELWSFPATSGILFAAGRRNLAPHDYWYPGRPDHAEENRVLAMLETKRPRYIVTLNRGWNFFSGAPEYFGKLRAFAREGYRLAARHGRYDVLGRRDLEALAVPASAPVPATMDDVLDPLLERRRQAAWRWMDSLTLADAVAAKIPEDRRDAILLMRALRDGGDMRGAAWAIRAYESGDDRVRREAVEAMKAMERSLRDSRARFAGDFDAAEWSVLVAPWAEHARKLEQTPETAAFARAVEEIAGARR